MASGKTTVGKELATRLKTPFFDTDELIEKNMGLSIPVIFEKYGEEAFRNMETDILKQIPLKEAVISTGGGVVLLEENINYLKHCTVIWLDVAFPVIFNRLMNDESRPLWKGQKIGRAHV